MKKWAEVVTVVSGKNQKAVTNPDGKYPIYGSGGLMGRADEYLCRGGATIVGRKGTINRPIFVNEPFWNVDTAFGIQPGDLLLPKYLFYFCQSYNFKSLDKSTTIPSLAKSDLLNIEMPVPSISEQVRIVARIEELFSQLDSSVETLKQTKQRLAVYRQAVLKEAFEDRITNYPYKAIPLKDMAPGKEGLRRGPFGGAIKKSCFVPAGYKVYEQGNAINDTVKYGKYYISEEKYQEMSSFHIKPHDLLVSCSGTLGKITELPADAPPGIINQALLRIRLDQNIVQSKFFIEYFRSELFQRKIVDKSQGSAMSNLVSIKEFREITMNIPSTETQSLILEYLSEKLSVCNSIEQTVDTALQQVEALRQSILKQAFEGVL